MSFAKCDPNNPMELFYFKPLHGGFQVIAREPDSKLCLDASNGNGILLYPCYEDKMLNKNQIWHLRKGRLTWGEHHNHLAVDYQVKPEDGAERDGRHKIRLEPCNNKKGQRLRKHDVNADGTFLIKDEDTKLCIGFPHFVESGHFLAFSDCADSNHRWKENPKTHGQLEYLRHDENNQRVCLDANDYTFPKLMKCHGGKTQHWKVDEEHGWLKLRHAVEDNGRRRFFERCIDSDPDEHIVVSVQPCDIARQRKVRWSRINSRIPPETVAWNKAPKPSPNDPVLGGDAAPPP
jgi:hypothetical protein